MKRFLSVRAYSLALVSLLLGIAFVVPQTAEASVIPTGHVLFQDLGDDDGDGIPNYLDPDNDNNGITDENDTTQPRDQDNSTSGGNTNPAPTPTPTAPTTSNPPVEETPQAPDSTDTSEAAAETNSGSTSTNSAPAPMVTSLPVTGSGRSPEQDWQLVAYLALGLLTLASGVRSHQKRM